MRQCCWILRVCHMSVCNCLSCLPSVLWCCWLGSRKGIRPVKNFHHSVWSEVQTCIWPSWYHCHSLSLAPVKSRLVLPFWYWLTWVVPDKGPLNVCKNVCVLFEEYIVIHIDIQLSDDDSMCTCYFSNTALNCIWSKVSNVDIVEPSKLWSSK